MVSRCKQIRIRRRWRNLVLSVFDLLRSDDRGFTLVELMVVVVISALLVSGGLAAYNRYNERQLVVGAGKKLYNDIRFIQGKAAAGEKPADCQEGGAYEGSTLDRYELLVVSNDEYSLKVFCVEGSNEYEVSLGTETLGKGVTLETSGIGTLFRVLAQGGVAEQFCVSGYNYIYRVRVSEVGEVNDDGLVETCTP